MYKNKLTQYFLTLAVGFIAATAHAQTTLPGGFIKMTPSEIVWKDGENGIKNTVLFG